MEKDILDRAKQLSKDLHITVDKALSIILIHETMYLSSCIIDVETTIRNK